MSGQFVSLFYFVFDSQGCPGCITRISTNSLPRPVKARLSTPGMRDRFTRNYFLVAWPQESTSVQLCGEQTHRPTGVTLRGLMSGGFGGWVWCNQCHYYSLPHIPMQLCLRLGCGKPFPFKVKHCCWSQFQLLLPFCFCVSKGSSSINSQTISCIEAGGRRVMCQFGGVAPNLWIPIGYLVRLVEFDVHVEE